LGCARVELQNVTPKAVVMNPVAFLPIL